MNVALISQNQTWISFILEATNNQVYKVDRLDLDVTTWTSIQTNYDVLLLDLDSQQEKLASLLIFNVRKNFGWSPYLIAVSPENAFSREQLMHTVNSGTDDFLEDVYDTGALLTKMSAINRRRYFEMSRSAENISYSVKVRERIVLLNGEAIKLFDKEFDLFLLLYGNTDSVFDRQTLYNCIWDEPKTESTRTLDTHISRIRRQLKLDGSYGLRIKPVYGVGYMLESVPF